MALDRRTIAARLQDINEGLVRQGGGLVEAHFRKAKRFGAAARVCGLVRGREVISDYNSLVAASGELGIGADTLDAALRELEEIGYVTVHRSGGDTQKIEERIPLLSNQFEAIGEKWTASRPGEIEVATLSLLDDLLISPNRTRALCKAHGLGSAEFDIIRDVGETGEFLKTYCSPEDGSQIAFSPLYHDENPKKLIDLVDAFPTEDVIGIIRGIRDYQGTPTDGIGNPVLSAAIQSGALPTPTVTSSSGPKRFVFTPLQGVGKMEKSLLEKARALVACVRYGQHFATITKIDDPLLILQRLRERRQVGPHSEIGQQYILVQKLGVGVIVKSTMYHGRYLFRMLDTEENLRALDMAIQYLTVQEVVRRNPSEDDARKLLIQGTYASPTKTRMDLKQVRDTRMSNSSLNQLFHLLIGGSSGID